jgi:hypothetical protein
MTIILGAEKPSLEDLAHFGVKGMKWGVRKPQTPQEQQSRELAKAIQKRDAIDGQKAFDGYGLRGWGAKKIYKRQVRKNPHFALNKLTKEETVAYNKAATRRAARSVMLRGSVEVAAILAGGGFLIKNSGVNSQAQTGAAIATVLLAGQVGAQRVGQLRSLRAANQLDARRQRVLELQARKK